MRITVRFLVPRNDTPHFLTLMQEVYSQIHFLSTRFLDSIQNDIGDGRVASQKIAHQELDIGMARLRFLQKRRQIVGDVIARVQKIGHGDNARRALRHAKLDRVGNIRLIAFHKTDLDS